MKPIKFIITGTKVYSGAFTVSFSVIFTGPITVLNIGPIPASITMSLTGTIIFGPITGQLLA